MKVNNLIITVLVALLVGGGAFFAGMKYQQSRVSTGFGGRQFQGQGGRQAGQGRNNGMTPVVGDIISQDDKSITVKLSDGSSKIVVLPDNITVSKTDTGSKADLKAGTRVGVFGTTNSDGSVTAQTVQINPMFGMNRQQRPSPSGV